MRVENNVSGHNLIWMSKSYGWIELTNGDSTSAHIDTSDGDEGKTE